MGKVRVTAGGGTVTVLGQAVTSSFVLESLVPVSAPQSTKASSDETETGNLKQIMNTLLYRCLNNHQSTVCMFIHSENSLKVPGAFVGFTD